MMDINELNEELFCVNYETRMFAQYVNYDKLERWIPFFSDKTTEDSHIKRYEFVSKFTGGKNVLDIACGTGKGSLIVAKYGNAKSLMGIDIEEDAIRYAKHRHKNENLQFVVGDATKYTNADFYDVIISFETVEHLQDHVSYLQNLNASLKPNGILVISTPISKFDLDSNPKNVFHVKEWGYNSFQNEIKKYLEIKEIYLQLYPKRNNSIIAKVLKKIRPKNELPRISTIFENNDLPNWFNKRALGTTIKGYQLLVCIKK